MAQPASRSQLKDYCLRQLGAPVLEINVADEQVDDIIDDAIQYFHERHFDGVLQTYCNLAFGITTHCNLLIISFSRNISLCFSN